MAYPAIQDGLRFVQVTEEGREKTRFGTLHGLSQAQAPVHGFLGF